MDQQTIFAKVVGIIETCNKCVDGAPDCDNPSRRVYYSYLLMS